MNFLTKLVSLRPGKTVQDMIKNVMQGKDEGADRSRTDKKDTTVGRISGGIGGRVSFYYNNSSHDYLINDNLIKIS